jgi:tetratricopeptide (TPR) repeat protein
VQTFRKRCHLAVTGALILQTAFWLACARRPEHYLSKGKAHFEAHAWDEAALNFRKAIQQKPDWGEAHYYLGLCQLKQDKKSEAVQSLRRAAELDPDNMDAAVRLADLLLEVFLIDPGASQAVYDDLTRLSERLLARDQNSFDGLRIKGYLALHDKRADEAVQILRQADTIRPDQPEVVRSLVQALFAAGKSDEAEALAQSFIQRHKTYGHIYDDLYAILHSKRRIAEAEKVFELKVANNPQEQAYYLQLAAHYYNEKKIPEMTATLDKLLADRATFPDARLQVGRFYIRQGNFREAMRHLQAGLREDPERKLAYRKRIVEILLAQGDIERAALEAAEMVREHPEDAEARFMRASIQMDQGGSSQMEEAIRDMESVRQKRPDDPVVRTALGRAYFRMGDRVKAKSVLQEALRVGPGYEQAALALGELYLAEGQLKLALDYADGALKIAPGDVRIRLLRAGILVRAGMTAEARLELTQLARDYPRLPDVHIQLGALNLIEQKFQEAEAAFRRVYTPGQADVRPLAGIVDSLVARRQSEAALQAVRDELAKTPDSKQARRLLAQTYLRIGHLKQAIVAYRELAENDPHSAEDQYLLALAYRAAGDLDSAIATLQNVRQLTPQNPAALSVLAVLLQTKGRHAEAKAVFREVLKLVPEDANTMNNLAYLLAETGEDLDEAERLSQTAVKRIPENPAFLDTLGWIQVKRRNLDAAQQIFERLLQKNPNHPLYLYRLGYVQIEKGRRAEAKSTLERAMQNQPSKQDEALILAALERAKAN